jgi:hypothetical protein
MCGAWCNMESTITKNKVRLRIEELLKERLNKLGSIKALEAWELCRSEFPYGVVCTHFRCIMMEFKREGYADFIRNGLWWIHKKR